MSKLKKGLIIVSVSILFTAFLSTIKAIVGIDSTAFNYTLFVTDVIGCVLIFRVIFGKKKKVNKE